MVYHIDSFNKGTKAQARTRSGSNASLQATSRSRSKSATPVPASGVAHDDGRPLRRSKRLLGAGKSDGGDSSDEEKRPPPKKPADKKSTNSKRGKKGKKAKGHEDEDEEEAVNGLSVINEGDEGDEAASGAIAEQRRASPQSLDHHQASAGPSLQNASPNNDTTPKSFASFAKWAGSKWRQRQESSRMSPPTFIEDGNAPPALGSNGPGTASTHSSQRSLFHDADDDAPAPEELQSTMNAQVDSTEVARALATPNQNADQARDDPAVAGETGGAYRKANPGEEAEIGPTQALANPERSSAMSVGLGKRNARGSHNPHVGHREDAIVSQEEFQNEDKPRGNSRKRRSSDLATDAQPSQENGSKSKLPRVNNSGQTNIPIQPEQEHDSSHALTAEEVASWDEKWRINWQVLHGNDCSLAECNEYRELYAKAVEIQVDVGNAAPPLPGKWGGMNIKRIPRAHLDNTRATLKRIYMTRVEGFWTAYINLVASEGDPEHPEKSARMAEKERDRMKEHAAKPTGWPYKPNDEPADIPPLSPEVKGGELALKLGFGPPQSLPHTLQGTWNFSHTLGAGAYGHAGLWEQFDKAGNIIQRIAVKETYLPGSKFRNAVYWATNKRPQLPKEGVIMQDLNGLPNSINIVKCHAMADEFQYAQHKLQRLYLEYCSHGDLQFVMAEHRLLQERKTADGGSINHRIPVNLLWSVFEALISATCLMKNGCLPPNQRLAGWTPILHRDIKPANIFLTPPAKANSRNISCWPGIPVPKLADFGIGAYIDPKHEPKNRWLESNPHGTLGYMAPERLETVLAPEDPSKIDVWSSARVILALMNLDEKEEDVFYNAGEDSRDVLDFKDGVKEYYSGRCPRLVRMVEECLSEDPGQRPAVEQIWQDVQIEVARYRDLEMEVLPLKQTRIGDDEPLVRYKVEQWPMWSR